MFKQSKINKSPIESILQDSFEQEAPIAYPQHFLSQHNQSFSNAEHAEFKISSMHNTSNIHEKLKIVKMISISQLENTLEALGQLFKNKALNSLSLAMLRLKRTQSHKSALSVLHKSDRIVVIRKIQLFYHKVNSVFTAKRIRNLGACFLEISLIKIKYHGFDKSSSIVSPYRGYSKVQNSDKGDSEWEMAQSQAQLGVFENLSKENKFLKKKKQKMKSNREQFYSKIDQMLSVHQVFLYKK